MGTAGRPGVRMVCSGRHAADGVLLLVHFKELRHEVRGNAVAELLHGVDPGVLEELCELPGVGRKSANLIMGDVFGKPAIVTDTHCIRLSNRIGLVDNIKEPAKVEKALWKIIPPEESNDFCHRLVDHGRAVCTARNPECKKCCLADICTFADAARAAES